MVVMAKQAGAFLTIGELADELGVPQHVLRYWESRFPQLRPLQRSGNRRYYRPDDVELARQIRRLLHVEGFTLRGAQRALAGAAAVDDRVTPDEYRISAPLVASSSQPDPPGGSRFDKDQQIPSLVVMEQKPRKSNDHILQRLEELRATLARALAS